MIKIFQLLFILTIGSLIACYSPEKKITIDNPTNKDVVVVFDNLDSIVLQANTKMDTTIKFGKRSLKVNNQNLGVIKLDPKKDYLLNPTKSNYYKRTLLYFSSQESKSNYERYSNDTIMIKGFAFKGEFEKYLGNLLIEKSWDINLNQNPKPLVYYTGDNHSNIHRQYKIYRERDLVLDGGLSIRIPFGKNSTNGIPDSVDIILNTSGFTNFHSF